MSYGLKCYTGGGYLSFDADQMDTFVRVITSGSVYLNNGESITIDAPGLRYAYTLCGTAPYGALSHSVQKNISAGTFTITNLSAASKIGYLAYKI